MAVIGTALGMNSRDTGTSLRDTAVSVRTDDGGRPPGGLIFTTSPAASARPHAGAGYRFEGGRTEQSFARVTALPAGGVGDTHSGASRTGYDTSPSCGVTP